MDSPALDVGIIAFSVAHKSFALLIVFALLLSACNETTEVVKSSDIYVIDGDTIDVDGQRYRLVGYDTPETYRAQCESERGDAATARLRALVSAVPEVTLQIQDGKDKYQRGLATLLINNLDVGSLLISEGLARRYLSGKRQSWC